MCLLEAKIGGGIEVLERNSGCKGILRSSQDMGRRDKILVHEEGKKWSKGISTDDALVMTRKKPDEGTEGRSATPTTPTPTLTTFGDDETIDQVLLNMSQAKAVSREKEKGVELKDVENIERPRLTSTKSLLTLKFSD
ncbi:hypothetical protein Tco_0561458 [Tanacetum coccineum]